MAKIIVTTDIATLSNTELLERARVMVDGIESNATVLPQIPANATVLRSRIDSSSDYQARANSMRAGASELEQKAKDEVVKLKTDIKANAAYVEQVVNKTQDVSVVPKLALKTRDKNSNHTASVTTIVPQSVSLHEVPYTRQALELKFKRVKGAKSYGIIWAYGNTSPDGFPKQAMKVVTKPNDIILNELESGKMIWVRVKSYNANNVESDWSDVVSRIVP